ncbi:hypothetical protein BDV59DRAFT_196918 [Aspergillus ambiguus]|uniref:DUF1993 domain-containing protein n=1 Tax=Aspergillus ambiguus TaxID=176160 RepID=UPI003CCDE147
MGQTQHLKASAVLDARLCAKMYQLADQIRLATQFSENLIARLTGQEPVTFEGNPTTFAECYERIDTVMNVCNKADKSIVDHHGTVIVPTNRGPLEPVDMSGSTYAHTIAFPNIYFHLVTAYGILRKECRWENGIIYYLGFFPNQVT